jgi:uncharacterized protein HemY
MNRVPLNKGNRMINMTQLFLIGFAIVYMILIIALYKGFQQVFVNSTKDRIIGKRFFNLSE